jgi:hypothetical protein
MGNKIYNDPSIQRRRNWDKNNKIGYRNSILSNTDTDNLVLCNIKDSMDNSLSTQNKMDYEYFSQIYNEVYRYISIDGGHKNKPFTKGGKSTPDNLEIQDASENISQSNKH